MTPQAAIQWQALRLSGQNELAVRASKKLKSDELLITSFATTRLRMELDRIPLWRGDHVAIKQLAEDFACYPYLTRLKNSSVLLGAIHDGLALLTWMQDAFGFADSFDERAGRYRGLRGWQLISLIEADTPGLLVKPEVACKQMEDERMKPPAGWPPAGTTFGGEETAPGPDAGPTGTSTREPAAAQPKRFHGTVTLDAARVGRDASRIADEVIAHLSGLVGAKVTVTLEVDAEIPSGAPEHVMRIVTENSRTLKFTNQGFEKE